MDPVLISIIDPVLIFSGIFFVCGLFQKTSKARIMKQVIYCFGDVSYNSLFFLTPFSLAADGKKIYRIESVFATPSFLI